MFWLYAELNRFGVGWSHFLLYKSGEQSQGKGWSQNNCDSPLLTNTTLMSWNDDLCPSWAGIVRIDSNLAYAKPPTEPTSCCLTYVEPAACAADFLSDAAHGGMALALHGPRIAVQCVEGPLVERARALDALRGASRATKGSPQHTHT